MNKLDRFLQIIGNGKEHELSEVAEKLEVSMGNLKRAAELLAQQNIILYDPERGTIRLSPNWMFLVKGFGNAN